LTPAAPATGYDRLSNRDIPVKILLYYIPKMLPDMSLRGADIHFVSIFKKIY